MENTHVMMNMMGERSNFLLLTKTDDELEALHTGSWPTLVSQRKSGKHTLSVQCTMYSVLYSVFPRRVQ